MKKHLIALIPATLLCIAFPNMVMANQSPTAFLRSMDQQLKPLLVKSDQNHSRILGFVNRMMDFDTLCRESLGRHWDNRTPAERKDFSDTLKALIEKNIVSRLKDTRDNAIQYQSETVSGSSATVVTTIRDGDGPRAAEIEIEYQMKRTGNQWIVVDMVTDGMSLVSNYRSQFNKMIEQDGWESMMTKMKEKLAE